MSELSWWFAPHPAWEPGEDWDRNVPVVRYETDDEVVLIDPFLPPDDSFDPRGKPVRVLLTQGAHYRGTADFVERYGASVWAPPRAVWRKIPNPSTTDELAELPIERVIIPHGELIRPRGASRIRAAVAEARHRMPG